MNWINIEVNTMDRPEMMRASNEQIGVWLRLMRYCCAQENGGLLEGASGFDHVTWLILARADERYFETPCPLWSWEGSDLRLWGYPESKETEVKNLRALGSEAGKKSGEARRLKKTNRTVQPTNEPNGSTATGTPRLNGIRKEVEREEEIEREREEENARADSTSSGDSNLETLAGATDALLDCNPTWDNPRVRAVVSNALRICPGPEARGRAVSDFLDELHVMEDPPDTFPLARFKGFMRHAADAAAAAPVPGFDGTTVQRFSHGE
jgi:hypothetical protein